MLRKRIYTEPSPSDRSFYHAEKILSLSLYILGPSFTQISQYNIILIPPLFEFIRILLSTMKLTIYLISVLTGTVFAFTGMNNLMKELAKRQAAGTPAPEMVGDLVQGAATPVGNQVKNCLLGTGACQDLTPKVNPFSQYDEFNLTDKLFRRIKLLPCSVSLAFRILAASGTTSQKILYRCSPTLMVLAATQPEPPSVSVSMMQAHGPRPLVLAMQMGP
jgi:hypothetical protein